MEQISAQEISTKEDNKKKKGKETLKKSEEAKEKHIRMVSSDITNDLKMEKQAATFEKAIEATNFGKYNIFLLLITIPSIFAAMSETTTIAYVVPMAECDLELGIEDKGYLISMTYLGMVLSALMWGFLSDTLGRRKILITGLFLNGFFVTIGGLAQSFGVLLFSKFMGGFIINGPYAIATTIVSEYNSSKYRPRMILSMGVIFSLTNITLPIIALGIFSSPIGFNLFGLKIHSWNILILLTAIPSFVSAICFFLWVPETPKFLMTSGRNSEALKVFRKVYSINTGRSPNSYPITELVDESKLYSGQVISSNKWEAFRNGFGQMRPLFKVPHRAMILLVCTLKLGTLMGLNSLRLWLPQLFTYINDYLIKYKQDSGLCTVLENSLNKNSSMTLIETKVTMRSAEGAIMECNVNFQNSFVYYNLMIISVCTISGYFFVGTLINLLGKKNLYVTLGTTSGLSAMLLYFAPNSLVVTAFAAAAISLSGVNSNVLMSIIVDLFPTTLRTMAVAMALMIARLGSMVGNLIFPYLINAGCWPPFVYVGATTFFSAILAFFLPRTDKISLQ